MNSRTARVLAMLVATSLTGACKHTPRPVAATTTPSPSPSATPTPTPTPTTTSPSSPPRITASTTPRHSSPSVTPGPPRACAANEISVAIRTNKKVYSGDDVVLFTITATNVGHTRCRANAEYLYVRITDPTGRPITMPRPPGLYPPSPPSASSSSSPSPAGLPHDPDPDYGLQYAHDLRPGQQYTQGCDWNAYVADPDQGGYASKRAEPGTYHATAHWQYPLVTSAAVAFRMN